MKEHKERLNYIMDGKTFVAYPVNISGVVVEADSIEELKQRAKSMCKSILEFNMEIINQDEPFELKGFTDRDEFHFNSRELKLMKKLEKYIDLFGEID